MGGDALAFGIHRVRASSFAKLTIRIKLMEFVRKKDYSSSPDKLRESRLLVRKSLQFLLGMTASSKTLISLIILLLVNVGPCLSQTLDRYGGRTDIRCSNTSRRWRTEKIENRWWICTPDGYALFAQDVDTVILNDSIAQKVGNSKYGNAATWSEATLQRLSVWRFNVIGSYAHNILWPVSTENALPLDSKGSHAHRIKLPYFAYIRPSFYSMIDTVIHTWDGKDVRLLPDPVKNIFAAKSAYYTSYVPGAGVGDYFDPKMQGWMNSAIAQDWTFGYIQHAPYKDYLIGIIGDDGDQMFGFATGPDFPTVPAGHTNPSLSLLILSESPVQTANAVWGFVYADPTMYTKKALHDMLFARYVNVGALNAAWGSNYTTLDSSGSPITGELVGTGDGATLTFSHTLARLSPSKFSLQISLDRTPVGGDDGKGNIVGSNLAGIINDKTGLLQLVFKPNQAPRAGASITVSYVQNGWGIGTGLMDEDMRPSHRAWLGNTWDGLEPMSGSKLAQMNPGVKKELDAFLKQTAEWYFKMLRDGIHSQFPDALVVAEIGTWSGVPPAPVLQAAGEYIDLFKDGESDAPFDRERLDFISRNYGDKPILAGIFLAANPDSAFGNSGNQPPTGGFRTQAEKGQAYYNAVRQYLQITNSSGTNPHAGFYLWDWMDMWSEMTNWGLVSHLDNAYDGHEAVSASVPCSPPLQQYTCGGEPKNYGNYLSKVKEANALWLSIPGPAPVR
jgi:hypothetical protein